MYFPTYTIASDSRNIEKENYNALKEIAEIEQELIERERRDPKVQEYYKILKLMEMNNIDTRKFFLKLENRIRKTHEIITIEKAIELAKEYYENVTGKSIENELLMVNLPDIGYKDNEYFKPLASSDEVDVIYDVNNPSTSSSSRIYVRTLTKLRFDVIILGLLTIRLKRRKIGFWRIYKINHDKTDTHKIFCQCKKPKSILRGRKLGSSDDHT
ncbi:213aa long hypothetical protein [Pyrococcus horikoshii OT3]|uniref:Uncharacterized protein n=1 Tax=Pyrococcus horikoshii (strain ATCC 700860 / DSM 12428 / JCM 9974 / NBRC 100139 / OT-3) TaxID=70601 RepID=O58697_PYRHO|nr:213aa long hypothetical protein [Pyrococcus horikoshii OT3]